MIYFYDWKDGSQSFVEASSKGHAVRLLDEVGAADPKRLRRVGPDFMLHVYRSKDEQLPVVVQLGDETASRLVQLGVRFWGDEDDEDERSDSREQQQ